MKRILLFLAGVALVCIANAGSSLPQLGRPTSFPPLGPSIVGTPVGAGSSSAGNTTTTGTGAYTIATTGDDLIIQLFAEKTATYSLSSITTSSGTITTDLGFAVTAVSAIYMGSGIYRIHSAISGSYTITVTFSAATSRWGMILSEGTDITGVDGTTPAQNAADSTAVSSNSVTTADNNDLVLSGAANGTGGANLITWTSPFGSVSQFTESGIGMNVAEGSYAQPSAGAISSAATLANSNYWVANIIAYH